MSDEVDETLRRTSSNVFSPVLSRLSSSLSIRSKSNVSITSAEVPDHDALAGDQNATDEDETSLTMPDPVEATTAKSRLSRPHPLNFDTLLGSSPAAPSGRSALFDDAPKDVRDVPGTLHHQSDEHVKQLVARMGAVTLVKQMAEDLARRDAQVTLIQRRAEEREALLKRMLRECEVSNLDIEKRLRQLDVADAARTGVETSQTRGKDAGTRPEDALDERMSEAFSDTLEAGKVVPAIVGRPQRSGTLDGWKDYLLPGLSGSTKQPNTSNPQRGSARRSPTSTRKPSQGATKKALGPEVTPSRPTRTITRTVSHTNHLTLQRDRDHSDAISIKSSNSVASWALRLVGGNSDSNHKTARRRASTITTEGDMARSRTSSLSRTHSREDIGSPGISTISPRGSISSTFGPYGTIKRATPETVRSAISTVLPPNSPPAHDDEAELSLGPVEMDTILPDDIRPPTLAPQFHYRGGSTEVLTDRFGFIYDQRRRRRQNEAVTNGKHKGRIETFENHRLSRNDISDDDATTSAGSQAKNNGSYSLPVASTTAITDGADNEKQKSWQDYLKLSSFATTELLSHTPSAAPIAEVTVGDGFEDDHDPPQILVPKRGSVPGNSTATKPNPLPSTSRITSQNAELAQPSFLRTTDSNSKLNSEPDPVKSLLDQLTEVHDALQRDKTVKWNEFLRKVRAERKRKGEATSIYETRTKGQVAPETMLTDGELIGVAGLGNRGKVGRAKWSEFKNLVLGGIPVAYRSKVWSECIGASTLRIPGYYEELVNGSNSDPAIVQQIQMDITRTLTDNIFFRKGKGVEKLKEVLLAYAKRNPSIGYCQGMNLITGNLLLIMPTAEDAFWILTALVENILPEHYYDSSLLTSRADQVVLRQYVSDLLPQLSTHLEDLGIELEALTFQWFLSVFTDCLSAEALFRVWDVVFCITDGATFLFQVALALLKLNEAQLLLCDSPADVYGYINQRMTDHAISIDGLIRASEALRKEVRREDVIARRHEAIAAEQELAQQRERIRRDKGKGRAVEQDDEEIVERKIRERTALEAAAKVGSESEPVMIRRSSYSSVVDDTVDDFAELEVRTPMPYDEEVAWRG